MEKLSKETPRKLKLTQTSMPETEIAELKGDAEVCVLPMTSVIRRALKTQRYLAALQARGYKLLPPGIESAHALPIEAVNPGDIALGALTDNYKSQLAKTKK